MRATLVRGALLAVALTTVAVTGFAAQPASKKPAPEFNLQLLNGKTLHLADLKGTAVILWFWAPW